MAEEISMLKTVKQEKNSGLLHLQIVGKATRILDCYNLTHGLRNHKDSGDVSSPYFGKFCAISKKRQRSLLQTVKKLQLIGSH